MGRVWLTLTGAALCLACGGKAGDDDPTPTGGASATGGVAAAATGGTTATGGTAATGGTTATPPPEGTFSCGDAACALDVEACVALVNHTNGSINGICFPLTEECRTDIVSGADAFCECIRPGRCSCQHQTAGDRVAITKTCSDR